MNKYDFKELAEKLERCRNVNLNDVKLEDVGDISNIKISKKKNEYEKILDFVENTKNLYIFKGNGRSVKLGFSNNERQKILKSLYR